MDIKNKHQIQPEDTLFIYDTVFVYDTIWEYEYVYDTIWIYDTVYSNSYSVKNLNYLEPIKVKFIHLSPYHYRNSQLTLSNYNKKKEKRKKIKTSWYYSFRIKQRQKKKEPKLKKQGANSGSRLTLNPTVGSFNPTIFSRGVYSIEAYTGIFQHSNNIKTPNQLTLSEDLAIVTKNTTGYEFGVKANYNLFQFGAQLGVGIININEIFNYSEIQTFVDSTSNYNVYIDSTMQVDSTEFLDLLYYLETGIKRYTVLYDTSYNHFTDSSLFYTYDTTRNTLYKQSENQYRLLEIPIILSYEFGYAKTSYQIKIGGVNQIHLLSSGVTFGMNNQIIETKTINYTIYNFALYAGLGFVYDASQKLSFTFDVYYKHPLRDITKNYPINIRRKYYGGNISIRYRF